MKMLFASLLIAALAVQFARAAAPPPAERTKELHRAESMYLMGGKEHRSRTVVRVVVLIPADMTDDELIAVSDRYRAQLAAKPIIHLSFWDDAAAYKRFVNEEYEEDIPVEVSNRLKARYEKDPFRIYGKPVHSLQLLKPGTGPLGPVVRRTISY